MEDVSRAVSGGVSSVDLAAIVRQLAILLGSPDGTIDNVPTQTTAVINGYGWIEVNGSLESGVVEIQQRSGLTTDDLPEGSTNLYYTDARVDARIALADEGDQRIDAYGDLRIAADGSLRITP